MSITAKALVNAKYASNADTVEYTTPSSTRVIIDKFTATNTDVSARTITVNIVPSGGSVAASNVVTSAQSIAAGTSVSLGEMQNQILNPGDAISILVSTSNKVVIRISGREIT